MKIRFKYKFDNVNIDSMNLLTIILFLKNTVIGTCEIRKISYGFYISNLEIDKRFRSQGYGRCLLTKSIKVIRWMMMEINKSNGFIRLIAYPYQSQHCDDDIRHQELLKLIKFYKSFGFSIINGSLGNDSCRMELKI